MNFEGLEQFRYETTKSTMETLVEIVKDKEQTAADRIAAAKVVDNMSDSIIKAYLIKNATDQKDSTETKLIDKMDKLRD